MPNYRLTHKMTGTTVPATAGYYGAHNQSTTKWKQAGAEMYQWKSDDFANAYFMGATIDSDAYKTVTISNATDAAFDGDYVYSATVSRWLKSTTHSIYKDGTTWKLTDGVTTYTAADNGLNIPPATFTRTLDYPDTITVSSTAAGLSGEYPLSTIIGGKNSWKKPSESGVALPVTIGWDDSADSFPVRWYIDGIILAGGFHRIYCKDTNYTTLAYPPKTGWDISFIGGGSGDPPVLEYTLEATAATLSVTSSAKFAATSLSGTWYPVNGGTGTPVYSEYTISESWSAAESAVFFSLTGFIESATDVNVGGWNMAEQTIFESLKDYIGNTEDTDCFRGYLPVNENGTPKFSNVWMLTSGGTAGAFDVERTYGASGAWCNMLIPAEIVGVFENRTTAMNFAGAVEAWLKGTNNVNQVNNVTWCHLAALPDQPEEQILAGRRYWRIRIQLEVLYLTESVYA